MDAMKYICLFMFIFWILINSAYASEDCFYDPNYVSKAYVTESTGFSNIVWDDDEKEALIVLGNDEKVILQYAVCEEFGLRAIYQMPRTPNRVDKEYLLGRIIWLGEKVLNKKDQSLLKLSLKNKSFLADLDSIKNKKQTFVSVEGSIYESFLVFVNNFDNDDFYISITWHK